jgi:ABC-type uncharacterized transport system permease subunit
VKPVTLVILAGAISVAGTWSKKSTVETRQVIGIGFVALVMVIIAQANPSFAKQFGWLLVAATTGAYGEDLFKAVGNATAGVKGQEPK